MQNNQLENERPIDKVAKESYSWLGKSYVFINKTKIKTWQGVFLIAFLTGLAVATMMMVSTGFHSSSSAADNCSSCFKGVCDGKCDPKKEGSDCPDCFVPSICGNEVVEPGEECDLIDLANKNCESLSFVGGDLSCSTSCIYDVSACFGEEGGCGDGHCDGTTENCNTCPDDCGSELTSYCGDGVCNIGEDCSTCSQDCVSGILDSQATCDTCFKGTCDGRCNASQEGADCLDCTQEESFCCGDGDFYDSSYCGLGAGSQGGLISCCGDGYCGGSEGVLTCGTDCAPCIDSDGGANYSIFGATFGFDAYGGDINRIATYSDQCDGAEGLMEFYCNYQNDPHGGAGYISMENASCDYGCESGACQEATVCKDSDNGDYFTAGTIIGQDSYGGDSYGVATYVDQCDGTEGLMEFYCEYQNDPHGGAGYVTMENISCDYGCVEGACVKSIYAEPGEEIIWEGAGTGGGYDITGINNAGQVVGTDENMSFVYTDGYFDDTEWISGEFPRFYSINNLGEVGGSYRFALQEGEEGFVYKDGNFMPIYPSNFTVFDMNDNDVKLVGVETEQERYLLIASRTESIVYNGIEEGMDPKASAINNDGHIVGDVWWSGQKGFYYDGQTFTFLEFPGAEYTRAISINNNDKVVGVYTDFSGNDYGFVYYKGEYRAIEHGISDCSYIVVSDINDSDQITISCHDGTKRRGYVARLAAYSFEQLDWEAGLNCSGPNINNAGQVVGTDGNLSFIYTNGVFEDSEYISGQFIQYFSINNLGEVGGSYRFSLENREDGFVYKDGVYTNIEPDGYRVFDINDNGLKLVGRETEQERYLHSGTALTPIVYNGIEDGMKPKANAINNDGHIVGTVWWSGQKGFYYDGQTFTFLEFPGAEYTDAFSVNNNGKVVGMYADQFGDDHGFVYYDGIYNTVDMVVNGYKQQYSYITDINDNDVIVGEYTGSDIYGTKQFCVVGQPN